jgi:hypothetical protein
MVSGFYAVVPGGTDNIAQGAYSFATGRQARALHAGAFVWGDSTATFIDSTATNQFLVRASGGVTMFTNSGATSGARLSPGSGTWASVSDVNMKANFAPVDAREVAARVAALPISTWNYKTQDATIRHIGPMAQDFYAAFGIGEDDKTITTIDADGVALAAIQGLYRITQDQAAQIVTLQQHNAALEARLAKLEQSQAAIVAPAQTSSFNVFNLLSVVALVGVVALWLRQRASQGAKK